MSTHYFASQSLTFALIKSFVWETIKLKNEKKNYVDGSEIRGSHSKLKTLFDTTRFDEEMKCVLAAVWRVKTSTGYWITGSNITAVVSGEIDRKTASVARHFSHPSSGQCVNGGLLRSGHETVKRTETSASGETRAGTLPLTQLFYCRVVRQKRRRWLHLQSRWLDALLPRLVMWYIGRNRHRRRQRWRSTHRSHTGDTASDMHRLRPIVQSDTCLHCDPLWSSTTRAIHYTRQSLRSFRCHISFRNLHTCLRVRVQVVI